VTFHSVNTPTDAPKMLPDNIANSYREYKADTEIFVTWLVETASRCGFVPSTTAPAQATAAATGGRLKGKRARLNPKSGLHKHAKSPSMI